MEEEKQNQPETELTQTPTQPPTAPTFVGKICKSCKMPNKQYRKLSWKTCTDCLAMRPKREQSEGQKRAFQLLLQKRQEQIDAIRQTKTIEKEDKESKNKKKSKVIVETPYEDDTDDDSPLEEVIKVVKKVKPQAKPQPQPQPQAKKPKVKKVIVEEEYDDNNNVSDEEYEEYEEKKNKPLTKPKRQNHHVVNNQLYVPKYTFY